MEFGNEGSCTDPLTSEGTCLSLDRINGIYRMGKVG